VKRLLAVGVVLVLLGTYPARVSVVVGDSMEPAVASGSIVVYERATLDELRAGDVVCLNTKYGWSVMHRIQRIYWDDNTIVMKGDNNGVHDPLQDLDRSDVWLCGRQLATVRVPGLSAAVDSGLAKALSRAARPMVRRVH
jgi:signal peptidase I